MDYVEMLRLELEGIDYSKAQHWRDLQRHLNGRTRPAIERKHQNISAILLELGYPYIDGYKPLGNYQAGLRDVVAATLAVDAGFRSALEREINAPASVPTVRDILSVLEPAPKREKLRRSSPAAINWRGSVLGLNYLEMEARNRKLGTAGEQFVVQFEVARLTRAGRHDLAERVEHTAQVQGDGAGFDVRSFEASGRDRFIEAKTTAHGRFVPFYLSRNELAVSRELGSRWHLYRLHNFRRDPRLFTVSGRADDSFALDPTQYLARLK